MFEPTYFRMSESMLNVSNIRKYVVTWLEHVRESNRPLRGPLSAKLSILFYSLTSLVPIHFASE